MKGLKKITCAALAAAVAASMTGCSLDASWIAKSGETKLPSGVYAAYVLQDVMYGYMMSGSAYLDQEGLSESLVEDAKAYCTELLAYQCKADEMGITLTEEEKAEAGSALDADWASYSAIYEANRVSRESMNLSYEISELSGKLFKAIYGVGGTQGVAQEEINAIFDENYLKAGLMIFSKPSTIDTTDKSEEEKKTLQETYDNSMAELQTEVDYWVEQAKTIMADGSSFNDVMIAYDFETQAEEYGIANIDVDVESSRYAFVDKRDETIPAELIAHLETAELNSVEVVETEEYLIIACPQDKNASEEDKVSAYDQILMELKGEDMTAMMEEYKESLNIEWNDGALKRFAPKKMLIGY